MKVRESSNVEIKLYFKEGESLETLSLEVLAIRLFKSLGFKVDEVFHMFGKEFDRVELLWLAH